MRTVILLMLGLIYAGVVQAQVGTSISADGTPPNTNAMLDVQSPSTGDGKGLLIPRITLDQRTNSSAALAGGLLDNSGNLRGGAAQGLIVYQTDGEQGLYFNISSNATPAWVHLGVSDNGVSVGQMANGHSSGAALGYQANGSKYGAAVGYDSRGTNYGAAVGREANGSSFGAAVGREANGFLGGAAVGRSANGSSYGAALGYYASGSPYGAAVGRLANANSYGVAIGETANGSDYGTALGYAAIGTNYGAAVGYQANGSYSGAALGREANGFFAGAAVGGVANGSSYGAAVGYYANGRGGAALGTEANGSGSGAAVGMLAIGTNYGAALGYKANGSKTNVAIGAFANAQGGIERIAIGHNVTNALDNTASIRGHLYLDGGTGVFYRANFGTGGWSTKAFIIDHPLDPENKVLRHFCMEGPQVWNVYAGNAQLVDGSAVVELPDYYSVLNLAGSEIYSLTVVGALAQIAVGTEVKDNYFAIVGDKDVKVSWTIKVLRNDPACLDDLKRRPVEQLKSEILP